jgi:hypothetical protein
MPRKKLFATTTLNFALATGLAHGQTAVTDLDATSDINDAIEASGGSSIIVRPGVTIDSTSVDMDVLTLLTGGYTITNNGTIEGGENDGIVSEADNQVINNNGVLSAERRVVDLKGSGADITNNVGAQMISRDKEVLRIDSAGPVEIDNAGLMRAEADRAVQKKGDGALTIFNRSTGSVEADSRGFQIEGAGSAMFDNAGSVVAEREAIQMFGPDTTLSNQSTGSVVSNTAIGVERVATIINDGEIRGPEAAVSNGTDDFVFSVANTGLISSMDAGDDSFGVIANGDGGLDLDNSGRIESTNPTGGFASAVRMSHGGVQNIAGGVIVDDNFGIQAFNAPTGEVAEIVNAGTIEGRNGSAIQMINTVGSVFNSGSLLSDSGLAVAFGATDDQITISAGNVQGDIDGGDGTDAFTFENPADFTFDDDIFAFESLTKNDAGNAILNGQAQVGNATVNAGRLSVNDTLTGDVTVTGGTLGGDGTIDGNVTLSDTLAPGNSPGSLVITGNLTLEDGSVIQWDLGDSSDELTIDGLASATGAWTLDLVSDGPPTKIEYEVLDGLNLDDSFFTNLDQVLLPSGWVGEVTVGPDSVLVTIPEPGSLALLGLGGLALISGRRRK